MSKTSIQWTEATWNPTVGCSLMSPGCTNCYAMKMAGRIEQMGGKAGRKYTGLTKNVNGNAVWTGIVRLDQAALELPRKWRKPKLIFVNSMSDLFHPALSWSDIDQVFAVMSLCGQHVFQVLTKRPDRMRDYLSDPATRARVESRADKLGAKLRSWPLSNVWCGTSIEDQTRANDRLSILLSAPAAVRFVSIEPLLGAVDLRHAVVAGGLPPEQIHGLHWVIVGGESGHKARPMHPDWARSLRDEAVALGIRLFYKQAGQWGQHNPGGKRRSIGLMPNGLRVDTGTPGSVTLWNLGKKLAGDVLDRQVWHEFPAG